MTDIEWQREEARRWGQRQAEHLAMGLACNCEADIQRCADGAATAPAPAKTQEPRT